MAQPSNPSAGRGPVEVWESGPYPLAPRFDCVYLPRHHRRCSSSVVEHSLGKGEVESSILSCSTIFFPVPFATVPARAALKARFDVLGLTWLSLRYFD